MVRYVIRCGACGVDAPLVGQLLSVLSVQVTAFRAVHDHDLRGCAIDVTPVTVDQADRTVTSAGSQAVAADYEVIAADGRRWSQARRVSAA